MLVGATALCGRWPTALAAPVEENRAKALAVFGKYAETQQKLRSYRYVLESTTETQARLTEEPYKAMSGNSRSHQRTECRTDGQRFSVRFRTWGNVKSASDFLSEARCPYNSVLWDGKTFFNYVATTDTPGRLSIYTQTDAAWRLRMRKQMDNPLWCHWTASEPFGPAASLSLRTNLEPAGQAQCLVIDATAPGGKYTAWLDPERGHNIAKATISYSRSGIGYSLDRVVCKEIAGVWVPVEGYSEKRQTFAKGDYTNEVEHLKVTDIALTPDHAALRSFVPDDIKNGAWVTINPVLHQPFNPRNLPLWQDGRVVDRAGKVILTPSPRLIEQRGTPGGHSAPTLPLPN